MVLLGDAVHTAHFSIGSGTKLAMEDVIALCKALREGGRDIQQALQAYEAERRPVVKACSERRRRRWSGSSTASGL